MTIYTVEVQAHTGAGGVATFFLANKRFNTSPADLPANQHFHPALQTPANFERALFSGGSTTGPAAIGFGEIVIINTHGRYDAWPDYAFDGRPCVIKAIPEDPNTGKPLWAYKDAPALIRGTIESVDTTNAFRTIRLRLYDRLADLDQPLLTARYAGTTTAAGGGAEGTADLKDTIKPRVYGTVINAVPIDVNPFDLIRQVSDKPCRSITVYDGGLFLDYAGDFASLPALLAATIAPGQYATALVLGLFRLGGAPVKTITADAVATGDGDAASIARAMLLDFGLSPDALATASFDALKAKNAAPCGYWVSDQSTALVLVTAILRSIGAWLIPSGSGVYSVGRLEPPGSAVTAAFAEVQLLGDPERLPPGDSNRGIPAWRVVLRYGRLWRTQNEDELAGNVAAARRVALSREWREAKAESTAVKARFLLAPEMTFDTMLINQADAEAEVARLLAIYSAQRTVWRFSVDMAGDYRADRSSGQPYAQEIALGSTASLQVLRFLTPPRNFIVIGRVEDCDNNRIRFDLWG